MSLTIALLIGLSLGTQAEVCQPYGVGLHSPKLTTPQWVGEEDVDAVVILSIDDMRETEKYENFLRPILDRLKQIDGRAPVSIFTNSIDPKEPHLQKWLEEGLSLEVHTVDHPCPLLCDGDFVKAKSTYDRCVDMMADIPNSHPVAFRMPCCDSLNTPSPRFWTEIFEKTTAKSNYLAIDSSVFNIFTADDPDLNEELVKNEKGASRFRHYVPFKSFVNTIENYPYPYIIGDTCWEFPCVVPSDWEAQHVQKPNNPDTVRDLKRALDATVTKQGVMPIVFHPHGWIRNDQLVGFVDYAVEKYRKRVKFLNFAECLERINEHLLNGVPLRSDDGNKRSVRLADVNADGYLDVLRASRGGLSTRVWNPSLRAFVDSKIDVEVEEVTVIATDGDVGFLCRKDGHVRRLKRSGNRWITTLFAPKSNSGRVLGHFPGIPIVPRDVDGDGTDELFVSNDKSTMVLRLDGERYVEADYSTPVHLGKDKDLGVRFVDLNADGRLDIVQSDGDSYGVWLFANHEKGWQQVRGGNATDADAIPVIANPDGTNNGAWFHSEHLWVQNENTARLPDLVDRASYESLLNEAEEDGSVSDENPLGVAKTLEESLATFDLVPGAKLEVVASEPQIQDPIAFDWGPDGKLWVVEMSDYPNGANWHGPGDPKNDPGGRVKILEDKDNDGHFETAHLFLDGLHYPTGVKAWRGGAIISGAPEIIYAEDTDGDNKADVQRILYTGFREGNQQHRTNGFRWSPDLWLHVANGDSGGKVTSLKTGEEVNISGRDFRIRPDEGLIEATSGQTQFGRCRDRWGNWFGGNNSHPIWHYVLEEKYMGRNPHFSPPSARREIAEVPGAAPVYPTSQTLERFNDFDRANKFTSACSPEVYRGYQPSDLTGRTHNAFYVCEPVHNLVHRAEISKLGPTFTSRRFAGEEQTEFLTSSDNWFRPAMVRTGPDGAIWVADMYRMVIEHPEWIPRQWQDRIDHLAGNDKGRIYRVTLSGLSDNAKKASREWQSLRSADLVRLSHLLNHENGVMRDMAQQEIYERGDKAVIAHLRKFYGDVPMTIEATNLLDRFGALTLPNLQDCPPGLVGNLLRLVELKLNESSELTDEVLGFVESGNWKNDDRLAMQCAYTLGEISDPRSGSALAKIALEFISNDDSKNTHKYVRAAVMSSVTRENCENLMQGFLSGQGAATSDAATEFLQALIKSAIGYGSTSAIRGFVQVATANSESLERFSEPISTLLATLSRDDEKRSQYIDAYSMASLGKFAAAAIQAVSDQELSDRARLKYLQLFGYFESRSRQEWQTLIGLLSPKESHQLQRAALERLSRSSQPSTIAVVLERWKSFTPAMRDYLLSLAMQRSQWTEAILGSIESKAILPTQVGIRHRQRLLGHQSVAFRSRAEKLFAKAESDREATVQRFREQTVTTPSVAHGKQVFAKQCSACHLLEGQGRAIGPDLTAISDKSQEAMLVAILDPNRAVEEKYLDYTVITEDGVSHRGILLEESATSITLATPEGETKAILRNEMQELQASGLSLMPVGLEQVLSAQDIADVTSYVQSISVPRKRFRDNVPQVAPVRDDGSIRLFAIHAEIYGPNVVLEDRYHNLGFWSDANDRAVWTIDAPKAGEYELVLDYACSPQPEKNRFQIRVNGEVLGGEIDFTDSWDTYRSKKVGVVRLPDEPVQLTIQSEGAVNGFLMDLRTILLYPE